VDEQPYVVMEWAAVRVPGCQGGDRWLSDVAGDYVDRPSVAPLKRHDTVRAAAELEPLQQRVAC